MAAAVEIRGRSRESVLLLVLLLSAATLCGGAALLGYSWWAVDGLEADRETAQVRRSIRHSLERTVQAVDTATTWDEAVKATREPIDIKWVHDNFGVYYSRYFGHDVTLLFDHRGEPVYAAADGSVVPLSRIAGFAATVRPMVRRVQAEELRRRYGPGGQRNVQAADVANASDYLTVGGKSYLVAVSSIAPETLKAPLTNAPAAVVVSGNAMDSAFLADLGADLNLEGLQLKPPSDHTRIGVDIAGSDGTPVGRLTWKVVRPGAHILTRAGGAIGAGVLLMALLAALVLWRVRRLLSHLRRSDVALAAAMQDLVSARDQAEAANAAKSQFLANMSHEIRTPLNGVVGVVTVLAKSRLDAAQREMVEIIRSSGETLERLLSDVLDLARIESGRMTWEREPFALGACVGSVADLLQARAREKGIGFAIDAAPGADALVLGDAVRLKQILTNLLSNAIKFTDKGEVRLSVSPIDTPYRGFRFEVTDTGVGFDPEQKARLFGRFQQADGSITRRFGGTGLGLAISRQLAEIMGGSLDCDSVAGEGSAFTLLLPLEPAENASAAARIDVSNTPACPEGRGLRILAVDDHPTNRRVLELILGQAGVEVTTAENGREALDALEAEDFDLVLMDMQMPVMDGISATAALRERERSCGARRVPVIMLTANAMAEHVQAALACGADRHLSKPIEAAALLTAVAELTEAEAPPRLSSCA